MTLNVMEESCRRDPCCCRYCCYCHYLVTFPGRRGGCGWQSVSLWFIVLFCVGSVCDGFPESSGYYTHVASSSRLRVKNHFNLYLVTFQMGCDPGLTMTRHLNKFCGSHGRLITSSGMLMEEQQSSSQDGKLMKMVRSESSLSLRSPESRTGSSVKISQSSANPRPPRKRRLLCEGALTFHSHQHDLDLCRCPCVKLCIQCTHGYSGFHSTIYGSCAS